MIHPSPFAAPWTTPPPVILADEPTAALDTDIGQSVMALPRQIAREKGSAVIASPTISA